MHTGQPRGRGRQGTSIRWYLTALVLLPLIGLALFAGTEARSQLRRAQEARRVGVVIERAELIAAARAYLQREIMPSIARSFLRDPKAVTDLSLKGIDLSHVGLTDGQVRSARAATDAALQRVVALPHPEVAAGARRVVAQLATARRLIDRTATMTEGFNRIGAVLAAIDSLGAKEISEAYSLGLDGDTAARLNDVRLIADFSHASEYCIQELAWAALAGPDKRDAAFRDFVHSWGLAQAAQSALDGEASPGVRAAVHAAVSSHESLVDPSAVVADYVIHRPTMSLMQLALVYTNDQEHAGALYKVLLASIKAVHVSASRMRNAADRSALLILGAAGLLLLMCGAVVVAVRRAISKPMQQLADEANQVSQGELLAVSVRGPREVRTVGRGLAAAVDNLRKIEAQASALAGGDLESDIVRQPLPGPLGAVMHRSVSAVIDAIHERDAAQSDLAHRATHDALTELPNRTQAMEVIRRSLHRARRTGSLTGLMFIDLDHFKRVNDSLGHNAGDVVLQTCARRMTAALRAGDTVFRLGGDEFLMLMEDVASELDAVHLAERLIERISAPIAVGENVATVGASIGVAFSRDASVDAERLLNDADAAAYRAKQSGRGRVGIFDDALRATLAARADVETALTHALVSGELVLYYQPIVELGSGRIIGAEALMRWHRPGHGLVPPNDFIPVAEASSLINDLGRWALGEATAQLAQWDAQGCVGPDFTVAVNVSGRHLVSSHLIADVQEALDRSGIAPHRLTLELTETVLVDDPLGTRNLELLREHGVHIAIDDFGTGYTSIGQLPRLPIDKLKIDRSFVSSTDPTHRELIPLIVAAAHAFGMIVVAEGIETPEQAEALGAIGVDNGQGFYFARPQPASTPDLFEFGHRQLGNTA